MTPKDANIFLHGAILLENFITPAEEIQILYRISASPWSTELRRRVQHYGYRYDYNRSQPPQATHPLPMWASNIAMRLSKHFANQMPVQCIVNEYEPEQGIGMHADHKYFGPVVASLSLGASWPMRFRRRAGQPYARTGLPNDQVVTLPRRSMLVLDGDARTGWMHGIDPADTALQSGIRVSATFRTLANR